MECSQKVVLEEDLAESLAVLLVVIGAQFFGLGLIGAGGIGQVLYENIRSFEYGKTAVVIGMIIGILIAELIDRDLVIEGHIDRGGLGRPGRTVQIHSGGPRFIGAELQTGYAEGVLTEFITVDVKGEILEHDPMASERRAVEGDGHGHGGGSRRRENA